MKKVIAILTTAVLASALITGCSGDVEPTSSNSSQDTNSSQQATVSTDGSTSMEKVIGYLSEAYMEDNKNVKVTADPALDLDIADEKLGKAILKNEGVPSDKKLLGVSVRKWQNLGGDFETQIANACDYAYEKYGYYTVFLPMQSSRDTAIMQNIKRKMKHESAIIKKR